MAEEEYKQLSCEDIGMTCGFPRCGQRQKMRS